MRILIGKVRSGKTALMISEIRETVAQGNGRVLFIVPEQYSHEAERELCAACGDRFSRCAEVMSFSGLARYSMSVHGGLARSRMDKAGKLLCLAAALREIRPVLRIYDAAVENIDLQMLVLQEMERLSQAGADAALLHETASSVGGDLGEKLEELNLIRQAWEAVASRSGASAEEPLQVLARQIDAFGLDAFDRVYVDGFIDFTGLEYAVLKAMMKRRIDLTVCLPDSESMHGEEFLLPSRRAREDLCRDAEEIGLPTELISVGEGQNGGSLRYFADHMFDYAAEGMADDEHAVRLLRPMNPLDECEIAAAAILDAVRREGCRWRDIAVAVRGFEDYRGALESCFRRYGIPLFVTHRDPVTEKPLPLWIDTAYDVILGRFDPEDVAAFLRCGLSGLDEESCDALCAYLYKWQLRAPAWQQPSPWEQHPDGFLKPWTDDARERLRRAEEAREKTGGPLLRFRERAEKASDCRGQAEALSDFMKDVRLHHRLQERVEKLRQDGNLELCAQYRQLWDLCCDAVSQTAQILGDLPMDARTYQKLLRAMFSQYDIGIIPVALDRVSAGDFDRMRRRNIRRLFVLGCSDERLPAERTGGGLFTDDERDLLYEHKIRVGGGEAEQWREYAMIYHTLSLPSEQLTLSAPYTDFSGNLSDPALVWKQAQRLFCLQAKEPSPAEARLSARIPALSLAVRADRPDAGREAAAAADWFRRHDGQRLEALRNAARREETGLSKKAVEALYGRSLHISPSRLEQFSSCRFCYYCRYGLKAEPFEPAGFRPPEIGSFVHAVLEETARGVTARGGFAAVSDDEVQQIAQHAMDVYIHEKLDDLNGKSPRFVHLFRRVCEDARLIVKDTAEELRRSDFVPKSFELDISQLGIQIKDADMSVRLTGIADRVDGFEHGGRLYLRVVDYKTGKKQFCLSDLLYGKNMQMLLYLFALCEHARELYGEEAVPAGILYLPAREELLSFDRAPAEGEDEKERKKGKRRSGLMLEDESVLSAWEHVPDGEKPVYMPVRTNSADPVVSEAQFTLLRRHLAESLRRMGEEILNGSIEAKPSWVSESDNACRVCDYASICGIRDSRTGAGSVYTPRLKDAEVWEILNTEDSSPRSGEGGTR